MSAVADSVARFKGVMPRRPALLSMVSTANAVRRSPDMRRLVLQIEELENQIAKQECALSCYEVMLEQANRKLKIVSICYSATIVFVITLSLAASWSASSH